MMAAPRQTSHGVGLGWPAFYRVRRCMRALSDLRDRAFASLSSSTPIGVPLAVLIDVVGLPAINLVFSLSDTASEPFAIAIDCHPIQPWLLLVAT